MNLKPSPPPSSDPRLSALLREARPVADLPPGFQGAVWRRIEHSELREELAPQARWLDQVVTWLLRPRLAFAGALALVVIGAGLGARRGIDLSTQAAQARYVAAVSPLTAVP